MNIVKNSVQVSKNARKKHKCSPVFVLYIYHLDILQYWRKYFKEHDGMKKMLKLVWSESLK